MRVALLLAVENGLVYDEIWRKWLQYVPTHQYAVFVHARQPALLTEGSFAAEHLVDVNITAIKKDELDDVEAFVTARDNFDVQRLLLNLALQLQPDDNPVTHFIFGDADTIPVKSFDQVAAYLQTTTNGGQHSLIQFCPHQIKTEAGRKILHMSLVKYIHALRQFPEFARDIPVTHWYWNSKFIILCREHATSLCADTVLSALLPKYKITNMCTHYPMLVLSKLHGDDLVNIPTTFEAWGADGQVRVYRDAPDELMESLRFENLLFASGIARESKLHERVAEELWGQPHTVDPDTGKSAQYTGL